MEDFDQEDETLPGRQGSASELCARLARVISLFESRAEAASVAGVSVEQIRKYVHGLNKPSLEPVARLAAAKRVSLDWVWSGEGPMEIGHHVGEPLVPYGVRPEAVAALGDMREFVLVPHYDVEASAGAGREPRREEAIGTIAFRRDWLRRRGVDPTDANVIRVIGDSMEPELPDGALVLVDTAQEHLGADGIYVLMLDGDLVTKRLQRDLTTGGVIVHSANPAYNDQQLSAERAAALNIIGRVIWAAKEI